MADNYKGKRRNVHFRINSPTVNLEIKYVWYQKLFKEQWALSSGFNQKAALLTKLSIFLNEKYPYLPIVIKFNKSDAFWHRTYFLKLESRRVRFWTYSNKTL